MAIDIAILLTLYPVANVCARAGVCASVDKDRAKVPVYINIFGQVGVTTHQVH